VREVARGHVLRNRAGEGAGAPGVGRHVDGCIATRAGNYGPNEASVREVSSGHVLRSPAGEGAGTPRVGVTWMAPSWCTPGSSPTHGGFAPKHGG